eukprot:10510138-Alexandrium_andersonii.AAC.1
MGNARVWPSEAYSASSRQPDPHALPRTTAKRSCRQGGCHCQSTFPAVRRCIQGTCMHPTVSA